MNAYLFINQTKVEIVEPEQDSPSHQDVGHRLDETQDVVSAERSASSRLNAGHRLDEKQTDSKNDSNISKE